MNSDDDWMELALEEAARAAVGDEVPVGAVVVRHDAVLGLGRNAPIGLSDPSAHAEIMALRAASHAVGNYRLPDADLFVTVEPCTMCVGAILHARIRRVVYGCEDAKGGALGSVIDLSQHPGLNHRIAVTGGVRAEEARQLLQRFFASRRAAK
jgi:tRNA(adenine34) deaminase